MTSSASSRVSIRSRRRKKQQLIRMKPPWLAEGHQLKSFVKVFALSLLLVANLISCDSLARGEAEVSSHEDLPISRAGSEASRLKTRSPLDRQQAINDGQVQNKEYEDSDEFESEAGPVEGTAQFAPDQPKRVVASSDQSEVFLPCKILNLDLEQTVSWIRKRDSLVLTIDKLRLVDDARFQLSPRPDDYTLSLTQPRHIDAGFYECQVSSLEPKLSGLVELMMVDADSTISNFSSLFVRPGEPVNLTCTIRAPHRTNYVYWYKNQNAVVLFDNNLRQSTSNSSDTTPLASRQRRESSEIAAARKSGAQLKNVISAPVGAGSGRVAAKRPAVSEEASTESAVAVHTSSSSLVIKQAQLNDTANYTCVVSSFGVNWLSPLFRVAWRLEGLPQERQKIHKSRKLVSLCSSDL